MMSIASSQMTLEEYLNYDDRTDTRYELVNGKLVSMPPESRLNSQIAMFLVLELAKIVPFDLICHKDTEIETSGRLATARLPDVMVLTEELKEILGDARGTINRNMPPPSLAIEVVSPGKENEAQDYRYKRSEYAARGIEEYWIFDPIRQVTTVLILVEGLYEERVYRGDERIVSPMFPDWELTSERVMKAGR